MPVVPPITQRNAGQQYSWNQGNEFVSQNGGAPVPTGLGLTAYNKPSLGMGTTGQTNIGAPAPVAGNLAGGGVSGYAPQAGGVPSVPNPVSTAGQAISGNVGNFPGIASLGQQANQFTQGALTGAYQAGLPGYQNLISAASGNIASNLAGQIPADVQAQLARQAAERGVASGAPGSPNSNAALMRALGLTSLDLQNLGQTQLTQAINRTPIAQQFNPAQFYVTPGEQQAAQFGANLYAAAPIPQYAQNAAMAALGRGLSQGQGATGPSGIGAGTAGQDTIAPGSLGFGGAGGVNVQHPSGALGFGFGSFPSAATNIMNRYASTVGQGTTSSDAFGGGTTSYGQLTPDEADYLYGPGPDAPIDNSFYPDTSTPDTSTIDASNPDY